MHRTLENTEPRTLLFEKVATQSTSFQCCIFDFLGKRMPKTLYSISDRFRARRSSMYHMNHECIDISKTKGSTSLKKTSVINVGHWRSIVWKSKSLTAACLSQVSLQIYLFPTKIRHLSYGLYVPFSRLSSAANWFGVHLFARKDLD